MNIAVWTLQCWKRWTRNEKKITFNSLTEVQPIWCCYFSTTYTQYFVLAIFSSSFFRLSTVFPHNFMKWTISCAFIFIEIDHGRFLENHHFESFKHSLDLYATSKCWFFLSSSGFLYQECIWNSYEKYAEWIWYIAE